MGHEETAALPRHTQMPSLRSCSSEPAELCPPLDNRGGATVGLFVSQDETLAREVGAVPPPRRGTPRSPSPDSRSPTPERETERETEREQSSAVPPLPPRQQQEQQEQQQ
eukprot:COSAG01_NODE_249_length_20357_cov_3.458171_26_plen_110_part_00